MKIGIAVQNDYPSDREIRPRKAAKELDSHGHEVIFFSRQTEHDATRESLEFAEVIRFSCPASLPFHKIITMAVPINIFWILWLLFKFKTEEIDVLIASNIRAGLPSSIAAKITGTPIVLDLQENNPEVVKLRADTSIVHFLTHNPQVVAWIENICIRLADKVWVVVAERKDDLISKGWSERKITVVGNLPLIGELDEQINENKSGYDFSWPGFTLVYVGALTNYRGLERILKAIFYLVPEEEVYFAIAGSGPHKEHLEQITKDLDIEEYVFFTGWIKSEHVPLFLNSGDVGVIPHDVTPFTNTTIPNKLFDYMMVGLSVLATDMKPVTRVISNVECGEVFSGDSSPEAVADVIRHMKKSEELDRYGERGSSAIREQYNWETESEKIISTITNLASEHS